MGIKFYCPNGHKLNVKSFLAGKKAICPKCNVKVLVPFENQAPGAVVAAGDAQTAQYAGGAPQDARSQFGGAGPGGQASAGGPGFHAPGGSVASNNRANVPSNYPAPGPAEAMMDPIDEAPNAVWYVRPPSGGQFGPAAGPTMRSWIQEGRVSGNALVWRDGWPEWRSAAVVFPSLGAAPVHQAAPHGVVPVTGWQGGVGGHDGMNPMGQAGMPIAQAGMPMGQAGMPMGQAGMPMGQAGMPMAQAGMPMGQVVSALESPLGGYDSGEADDELLARRKRRKKEPDMTLYVTAALVIMTIILVVVLVFVLLRQTDDAEPPAEPPAKTSQSKDEKAAPAEDEETPAPTKTKAGKKKAKDKGDASPTEMKSDTMQSN